MVPGFHKNRHIVRPVSGTHDGIGNRLWSNHNGNDVLPLISGLLKKLEVCTDAVMLVKSKEHLLGSSGLLVAPSEALCCMRYRLSLVVDSTPSGTSGGGLDVAIKWLVPIGCCSLCISISSTIEV